MFVQYSLSFLTHVLQVTQRRTVRRKASHIIIELLHFLDHCWLFFGWNLLHYFLLDASLISIWKRSSFTFLDEFFQVAALVGLLLALKLSWVSFNCILLMLLSLLNFLVFRNVSLEILQYFWVLTELLNLPNVDWLFRFFCISGLIFFL